MTKGIEFRFNAPFQSIEKQADGSLLVHLDNCEPIPADAVLVSTGPPPNPKGPGLEGIGVEFDSGGSVKVAEQNQSPVSSKIGREHVCTTVPNAHLVIRLLLEKNNKPPI